MIRAFIEMSVAFIQMCFLIVLTTKLLGNIVEIFSTVCVVSFIVGVLIALKN